MNLEDMRSVRGIQSSIFVVNWNLGKRCNYSCSYCPKDLHDLSSGHLTFVEMTKAFGNILRAKKAAGDAREIRLELTGGEPTLNPDLEKFLSWLRCTHGGILDAVGMTTNGSRTEEYYANLFEFVDYVTFSAHFEFMNSRSFFTTAISVHRKLRDSGCRKLLTVNLMMEPWAADKINHLVDALASEHIPVRCSEVRNYYNSQGLNPKWDVEFDYARFLDEHGASPAVASLNRKSRTTVNRPNNDKNSQECDDLMNLRLAGHDIQVSDRNGGESLMSASSMIDEQLNRFLGWSCNVGSNGLHIYHNGDVYGSICRAKRLGNVFEAFSIKSLTVTCQKEACVCPADVRIPKYRKSGDPVRVAPPECS
ncbi:radical SAM protein [Novipirellula sp. SH528]|uniref:radical SAM protein n=1 Tax=Novipirellula sp. SH528 TaxID=3454466 RepID=UPI003F9FD655